MHTSLNQLDMVILWMNAKKRKMRMTCIMMDRDQEYRARRTGSGVQGNTAHLTAPVLVPLTWILNCGTLYPAFLPPRQQLRGGLLDLIHPVIGRDAHIGVLETVEKIRTVEGDHDRFSLYRLDGL